MEVGLPDDTETLIDGARKLSGVTPYRWVILILFSVFSLLQSAVWDTWGPISPSATEVIGFTPHDYDLLSNWAPIGIMVTMPFFIWLMNNKGTQLPVILANAKQINYYMYGEFAFAVIIGLATLFLFRNKPALPPSASAAVERLEIITGLKALSKKYSYWAMVISFALACGAFYGWYGIITYLLKDKVSAKEVGNAAFVMTIVGTVMGIVVGWFADRVKGHLKWILFTCYCTMFVVFLYLAIMVMDWVDAKAFQFTDAGFWATFIIIGSVSNIIQPIGMEMAADIAYPVKESTSTCIVAWFIMFFMFIFLLVLNSVADQGIANYLFLVFVGLAAPVLAVSTKDRNVRLEVDKNIQDEG